MVSWHRERKIPLADNGLLSVTLEVAELMSLFRCGLTNVVTLTSPVFIGCVRVQYLLREQLNI